MMCKQEFKRNLGELWEHGLKHGFWSTLQNLVESLDPLGEKNALKVSSDAKEQTRSSERG